MKGQDGGSLNLFLKRRMFDCLCRKCFALRYFRIRNNRLHNDVEGGITLRGHDTAATKVVLDSHD